MKAAPTVRRRVLYVAEPAGAWAQHPPAVVDCSVMAALLWDEPAAPEARRAMRDRTLHAPDLLAYELANVARNKCRSGVPQDIAQAGLEGFSEQVVRLHELDPRQLFATATRHEITAYDAAYLSLAQALNAPLLTFDQKLADAAARALGSPD